jgi:hypothetical protein
MPETMNGSPDSVAATLGTMNSKLGPPYREHIEWYGVEPLVGTIREVTNECGLQSVWLSANLRWWPGPKALDMIDSESLWFGRGSSYDHSSVNVIPNDAISQSTNS